MGQKIGSQEKTCRINKMSIAKRANMNGWKNKIKK